MLIKPEHKEIYEEYRENLLMEQRDKISGHLYDWSHWDLAEFILNSLSLEEQESWYNQLLEAEAKKVQEQEQRDKISEDWKNSNKE